MARLAKKSKSAETANLKRDDDFAGAATQARKDVKQQLASATPTLDIDGLRKELDRVSDLLAKCKKERAKARKELKAEQGKRARLQVCFEDAWDLIKEETQ